MHGVSATCGGAARQAAVWPKLIAARFRVRYTLRGVSLLLHRMGFSPLMPKHRPVERDEEKIAAWRKEAWQQAKS